ncbi:MAG TPA: hypothetical protein VHM19_19940, partial [Polyangiales bacterium]|nr:hypothetical protein [Polyangiales bacterium]
MSPTPASAARAPIGLLSGVYACLAVLFAALSVFVGLQYEPLLVRSLIDRNFGLGIGGIVVGAITLELVLGSAVLRRHASRARRSLGRGRFMTLGAASITHALTAIVAAALLLRHARAQDLLAGFGISLSPRDLGMVVASAAISFVAMKVSV